MSHSSTSYLDSQPPPHAPAPPRPTSHVWCTSLSRTQLPRAGQLAQPQRAGMQRRAHHSLARSRLSARDAPPATAHARRRDRTATYSRKVGRRRRRPQNTRLDCTQTAVQTVSPFRRFSFSCEVSHLNLTALQRVVTAEPGPAAGPSGASPVQRTHRPSPAAPRGSPSRRSIPLP